MINALSTIDAPELRLKLKLKYSPLTADITPKVLERISIFRKLFVNRYAVAAGVTSSATTRMTPTVCNEATVTSVNNVISK